MPDRDTGGKIGATLSTKGQVPISTQAIGVGVSGDIKGANKTREICDSN